MSVIIGSARVDERGKYSGGSAGDQKQTSSSNDTSGEVSMQSFYVHSKGWYILRPKNADVAETMASKMKAACNNSHIGYDQGNRLGIISAGISTTTNTECDCSSLVRECIKEASGKDVGNFTTANEATTLEKSGLFESKKAYVSSSSTPLYNGDVLVTKTKGHTVIVVSANSRKSSTSSTSTTTTTSSYFPKYTGSSTSITTALKAVGCSDTSLTYRKKIASANGISNYSGTAAQNTTMLTLLKNGTLIKP